MKAYIFLADGFEDIEAMAPLDILRRGGVDTVTVGISTNPIVKSSHGTGIEPDYDAGKFFTTRPGQDDLLIFPGGLPGSSNLAADSRLMECLKEHWSVGGKVAAICAAPGLVLAGTLGNRLSGRRMTCYPGFEDKLEKAGATATGERVVVDGNLITGKGPGAALEFGLAILSELKGAQAALEVKNGMLV
ncbi:MAG: DJ-1/PfpI family protein [Bacteroidales bacterium]|nr:DJ-1/PfpI family protein [Bacteroidales bacterium]